MKLKNIKFNSQNIYYIFIILISFVYLRAFGDVNTFTETQYLFNYEFEFLKRGFLGEILRLTFENVNSKHIYFFSLFFLILLLIFLSKIFFFDFNNKTNIYKLIFSITILICPLTLQHFIDDIGRQDIVNLLITLFTFFLIKKFYKSNFFLATLVLFNSCIMLLIHEVSFFLFIPMIFSFWFLKSSQKNISFLILLSFLFIITITALISTHGLSTKFSYVDLNMYLLERYFFPFEIDEIVFIKNDALMVLYRDLFNSYDPNVENGIIRDTIQGAFKLDVLNTNLILIILLSPIFFIAYKLYFEFFKISNFKTKFFLISALTPLIMFLLGYDHMRWWSIFFTNIFIAIFYLSKENNLYQKIIMNNVKKYQKLYLYLIPVSFLLGPVKATSTFDILARFVY